jgi:LacI family transcriptional regulator
MKKTRHPTLREVAELAGVGTTTVSRVINGGQRVDPATLKRVQQAIEELGYMPNQAARTLKGDRARTIGLVIPSIADPFFASCAEAAQAVARDHDSLLIVLTTQNDAKAEMEAVQVLVRHRVDGFMIAPADSEDVSLRAFLRRLMIPVVALDRPVIDAPVPAVVADNREGARLATRHLIEHGYRRIVCLTGEAQLYTIHERIRGYRDEITAAQLPCVVDDSVSDLISAEHAIRALLSQPNPPDALLTLKNSTTIHTFEVLQKLGVAVPEKLALLGYDDFELAGTLRPSVSVIQQPDVDMGRLAAELLFQRLLSPATIAPLQPVQLQTRLIRRNSCGCEA